MTAIAVPNHKNLVTPKAAASPDMDDMGISSIATATDMFHAIAAGRLRSDRPLDMEAIDRSMTFHPSFGYTISVGTVTMDFKANKVLTIWNKRLQIFQLPKHRKNIGEGMLSGSMRETYEETGVRVRPLPLVISTRATLQERADGGGPHKDRQEEPPSHARRPQQRIRRRRALPGPAVGRPRHQEHVLLRRRGRLDGRTGPRYLGGLREAGHALASGVRNTAEAALPSRDLVVQKALRDAINSGYQIESLDDWKPES